MQDSNENKHLKGQLDVTFPKSNEDHRLQLVGINGSIFAIVHSPLESSGPITLNCEDWSLVLLAPINSKKDILIQAINIICFNDVVSEKGSVEMSATNRLVILAPSLKPGEKIHLSGAHGETRYDDDPSAFLTYFQLFSKVADGAKNDASFLEERQRFIASLCGLAGKIEGKTADLTIERVLGIWDISYIRPIA